MDIRRLQNLSGVTCRAGCSPAALDSICSAHGIHLPERHRALLAESNGLEAYFGYFRIFGLLTSGAVDAVEWNHEDYWKFAWEDRCLDFWCFGETGWGDQYAYRIDELRLGKESVYFLEAFTMTPEQIADTFDRFMEDEFLRNAQTPYDDMIPRAYAKLGPLRQDTHIVYLPPLLLSGSEELDSVKQMNARATMICNGDIALQLDQRGSSGKVRQVLPYEDEAGRMRLRLIWE